MNSKKIFLDKLAVKYNNSTFLNSDPIFFCYQYINKEDIEIVGFISALFSYGNVLSIHKHLVEIFKLLGKSPFTFIQKGKFDSIKSKIPKYRFQTSEDIYFFLQTLSAILKNNSSLENLFICETENGLLNDRIIHFQKYFAKKAKELTQKRKLSYGLNFLIGSGKLEASHKRYCMFLRWMVRDSFPDFGIYKSILKSDLLYPTDVHIIRLSQILGFSKRRTVDSKLAIEISNQFKEVNVDDPLAYDFPLSRLGILKICKAKYIPEICEACDLKKICKIYNS